MEFAGNRTECALLMLLRGWGIKYDAIRAEHKHDMFQVYNFSSERKMASVILRTPTGLRLFNKVLHGPDQGYRNKQSLFFTGVLVFPGCNRQSALARGLTCSITLTLLSRRTLSPLASASCTTCNRLYLWSSCCS